jgi:hypothetical protein
MRVPVSSLPGFYFLAFADPWAVNLSAKTPGGGSTEGLHGCRTETYGTVGSAHARLLAVSHS